MDPLVRRYLKTAIGFLGIGLVLGLIMIVRRELLGVWPSPLWISAHTHALLVGFVMMMIQGVALWMFPRPDKADARYRPELAEAAYWLVAVSTAARVAADLMAGPSGGEVCAAGGQLADESSGRTVERVASGRGPQDGHHEVLGVVVVDVELRCAWVEEHEPGEIRWLLGGLEDDRVQGPTEVIRGEDVEALAEDDGGNAHRVDDLLDRGGDR